MANDTYVSFYLKKERIHIFPEAIRGIGMPPYVRFLLAEDGKTMVMQPYNRKVFASMKVPPSIPEGEGKRYQMEISCALFCRYMAAKLGWRNGGSYRIQGRILPNQQIVLFDLTTARDVKDRTDGGAEV